MANIEELQAKLSQQTEVVSGILSKVSGFGELIVNETEQQRSVMAQQTDLIQQLRAEVAKLQISDLNPLLSQLDANNIRLQEAFSKVSQVSTQLSAIVPDEVIQLIEKVIEEISEPVAPPVEVSPVVEEVAPVLIPVEAEVKAPLTEEASDLGEKIEEIELEDI